MKEKAGAKTYGNQPPTGVVLKFSGGKAPLSHDDGIGDRLREIFADHRQLLIRFLYSRLGSEAEAQDVAQDAILRLYGQRERLQNEDLRALLFVTARNIATDRLRERKRSLFDRSESASEAFRDAEDEAASPERIVAARQKLQLTKEIIRELPSKCQEAFISYKLEGLEYGEIAARMKLTESMVRKYVIKALAYCAARFEAWEGEK